MLPVLVTTNREEGLVGLQMNKFEQIPSDYPQMSLAEGVGLQFDVWEAAGLRSDVWKGAGPQV